MKKIINFFKGLIIGGSMLVPGVSGGTMAMALGIYDNLIKSVANFRKNIKFNSIYLLIFSLGGLLGILIFARPISFLTENFKIPVMYFFIGAIFGGVPFIIKKSKIKTISVKPFIYIICGILIVTMIAMIPNNLFSENNNIIFSTLILLAAGFVSAVALVLPGISVSFMLLVLGIYDKVLTAIKGFDVIFLLPLFIGLLVGIISTTKILDKALNSKPQATYLIILGFVLGSVFEVFPGIYFNLETLIGIVLFIFGFFIMNKLSKLEE